MMKKSGGRDGEVSSRENGGGRGKMTAECVTAVNMAQKQERGDRGEGGNQGAAVTEAID